MTRRIEITKNWMTAPNVIPLFYSDTAFRTPKVVQVVADQVGLPVDAENAERTVKLSRFTQFNKGRQDRHLTELSPEQNEALYLRFKDFIDTHCHSLLEARTVQAAAGGMCPMRSLVRRTLRQHLPDGVRECLRCTSGCSCGRSHGTLSLRQRETVQAMPWPLELSAARGCRVGFRALQPGLRLPVFERQLPKSDSSALYATVHQSCIVRRRALARPRDGLWIPSSFHA